MRCSAAKVRPNRRTLWVSALGVVALVHAPALADYFAADDWYALDVFTREGPLQLLARFGAAFTTASGTRPHPIPALQFWLATTLFGAWYPGHAALLLGV